MATPPRSSAELVATKTLDPSEVESLRELTRGLMQRAIPQKHANKLVELGFARPNPAGLGITTLGLAKIAMRSVAPSPPNAGKNE
jgi:hypothetical protein